MIYAHPHLASSRNLLTPAKSAIRIFTTVLVAVFTCVNAQAEQIQTYTVADGLVGPVVPVIFQDSRGILWFGSDQNGVSRYDGNTFESYAGSLSSLEEALSAKVKSGALLGRTRQIAEDKWGHIWFLTRMPSEREGRVSRFDGTSISLIGTGNSLIVDQLGDVWVGENQRLTKYVTDAERPPQAQPNEIVGEDLLRSTDLTINVIFESKDGTLWLGGSEGEKEQTGVILSFREVPLAREPLRDDAGGKVDTGTPRMSVSTGFVRYDPSNLRAVGAIEAIAEDESGNLWFGGYNLLLRFDGKDFEQILPLSWAYRGASISTVLDTTAPRRLTKIRSDKKGRIWFSDEYTTRWWGGARLHTRANLSGFLEAEDAMGHLWFASEHGPQRYDQDLQPISYTISSSLENDNIHTIFEALDGKLWFGHDNGVTAFDPRPVIRTRAGIGTNRVRMIHEDSRGYLWFSIPGGVARYNPNADTEDITINSLRLGLTQNASSSTQPNATDRRQQTRSGARTEIVKMFEVNGHIWFVNFVDPRSRGRSRRYTFFRYANGKFDQVSISIQTRIGPGGEGAASGTEVLVSEGKHPWIAFGGNLFKADPSGLLRLTKGSFQRIMFGTTSEIDHGEAAITALYRDSNNRLWVHFENGRVLRYPKNIDRLTSTTRGIHPEILPLKATTLLKSARGGKWFFNARNRKIDTLE